MCTVLPLRHFGVYIKREIHQKMLSSNVFNFVKTVLTSMSIFSISRLCYFLYSYYTQDMDADVFQWLVLTVVIFYSYLA